MESLRLWKNYVFRRREIFCMWVGFVTKNAAPLSNEKGAASVNVGSVLFLSTLVAQHNRHHQHHDLLPAGLLSW